jgi:hypothetical protein
VRVFWPDQHVDVGFKDFPEQELKVVLLKPAGRYMAK